jgi:hypothetical protein
VGDEATVALGERAVPPAPTEAEEKEREGFLGEATGGVSSHPDGPSTGTGKGDFPPLLKEANQGEYIMDAGKIRVGRKDKTGRVGRGKEWVG